MNKILLWLVLMSVPSYHFCHFLTFLTKIHNACQRSTNENCVQKDYHIDMSFLFYQEKFTGQKTNFFLRFILEDSDIFFHSEVSQNTRRKFQHYQQIQVVLHRSLLCAERFRPKYMLAPSGFAVHRFSVFQCQGLL